MGNSSTSFFFHLLPISISSSFFFWRCCFRSCSFCSLHFCTHFGTPCFYVISVVRSHHNQLKTPRVGEPTTIIPTHVLNATEFYGQLGRHFSGFHYFQQRLNIRRSHFEYEPYSQMPGTIVISYFCCLMFFFSASFCVCSHWNLICSVRVEKLKVPRYFISSVFWAANAELVLVLLENGLFHRAKVLSVADQLATVNNIHAKWFQCSFVRHKMALRVKIFHSILGIFTRLWYIAYDRIASHLQMDTVLWKDSISSRSFHIGQCEWSTFDGRCSHHQFGQWENSQNIHFSRNYVRIANISIPPPRLI